MNTSSNVVRLRQADEPDDPLTDVLRAGARGLLAQAVELEAEVFLAGMRELKLPDGRDRLVRHGHGPERLIQTGIGPIAVSRVKIRDRGAASADRILFSSSILPKWARRTRSLDALLPVLYLRGVSTSRRHWPPCSAGTPRTCRPLWSPGSRGNGRMVVSIQGRRMYLWRAVDSEGEVLDLLVQPN